jgi:hypothetical protein
MEKKLTLKQEKFCKEYISTGNASEAYRRSYNIGNMKSETINRAAKQLIDNSKITTRVKQLTEKYEATVEKTITRLLQAQNFDFRKLYNEDGTIKQPHELDDDTAKCVLGTILDNNGVITGYKIIDIKGCTELVGKHLAMFVDKKVLIDETTDKQTEVLDKLSKKSKGTVLELVKKSG